MQEGLVNHAINVQLALDFKDDSTMFNFLKRSSFLISSAPHPLTNQKH